MTPIGGMPEAVESLEPELITRSADSEDIAARMIGVLDAAAATLERGMPYICRRAFRLPHRVCEYPFGARSFAILTRYVTNINTYSANRAKNRAPHFTPK